MRTHIPFIAAIGDTVRFKIFQNQLNINAIFDLASLTKPLITLKYVLEFFQEGDKVLNIPVIDLITHTSGIPQKLPWMEWEKEKYFEKVAQYRQNSRDFQYSCHNYNLLAYYVYLKSGKFPFQHFIWKEAGYLGLGSKSNYTLPVIDKGVFIGVPHDGKARMLMEKAGNAGLFGDIKGLINVAQQILKERWYPVPLKELYTPIVKSSSKFSLGWFMYSPKCKTCGQYFEFNSFGHSGFTGNFIWIHPNSGTFQIFLSHSINHIKRRRERFRFLGEMSTWLFLETLKD